MLLALTALLAVAAPTDPLPADFCGTVAPVRRSVRFAPPPPPPPPPPDGEPKAIRSAYPAAPHTQVSANFVVHWGDELVLDPGWVDALLASLEASWAFYVGEMGHVPPRDSEAILFNVYLSESFPGAPSADGFLGRQAFDPDGRSMIVMDYASTSADLDLLRFVSAHEAYHAMQFAIGYESHWAANRWWIEATATELATHVHPDDEVHVVRLHNWAFHPHFPIDAFDPAVFGDAGPGHAYGSFLFVDEVAERGGLDLIRDSFEAPAHARALDQIREELAEVDVDVDALWLDTLARSLSWDFEDGALHERHLQGVADDPDAALRFAVDIPPGGTLGVARAPLETAPRRYGANLLRWESPEPGGYVVDVDLNDRGSEGMRQHELVVQLVTRSEDGSRSYQGLEVDRRRRVKQEIVISPEVGEAWLVVAVIAPWTEDSDVETFSYLWEVRAVAGQGGHGGCTHIGGGAVWLWLGLPMLWRRRRR